MEFTGERYVPSLRGQIYYEHLHRYAIAARFCAGKRVLDIASGEGYGSALLAQTASEVVGVDVDQRAVDHARHAYYAANLRFMRGSTTEIPLADGAVDVIASFETIEHVGEHERMLDELRRVLVPGGVLIISSPNKLVYSDEPGFENPFHEKELYFSELRDLLVRRFRHVAFYGQRLTASSVVHPLAGAVSEAAGWLNGSVDGVSLGLPTLRDPVYFVALCSDAPLTIDASSAYVDPGDDLLADIWGELNTLRSRRELGTEHHAALSADVEPGFAGSAGQTALPPFGRAGAQLASAVEDRDRVKSELGVAHEERERLVAELTAATLERARIEGELNATSEVRARLESEVVQLHQDLHQQIDRARAEARAEFAGERAAFEQRMAQQIAAAASERAALEARYALEAERAHALAASTADLTAEIERERDRSVAASAELYELRTRAAALQHQLADHAASRASRDAGHAAALDALRGDLASCEERLGVRREEAETLRAEVSALTAHAEALTEALEVVRRDSVALREVLSSRSWKITSPLRRAFGTMRR